MIWRIGVSTVSATLLLVSYVYSNTRVADKTPAMGSSKAVVDQPAGERGVDADQSQANHKQLLADLKQARDRLQQIPCYETHFVRQVRKGDEILEPEAMDLKLRHKPFSVYLRWDDGGKQVLYVDGKNEDKLLVKLDKGLLGLAGPIQLAPDDDQAMQTSRYPITEIGLLNLVDRVLKVHEEVEVQNVTYERADDDVEGTRCTCYTISFHSPDVQPEYSKTVLHICSKTGLPLQITSYGWSGGEPGELLESYEYRDVKTDSKLQDWDFDPRNEAYSFRN